MKKILVLTDFSKKAENAAIYALRVAQHLEADIILYHSYEKVRAVNVPETGSWPYEDFAAVQNESQEGLKKLQATLYEHFEPGKYHSQVTLVNDSGYDLGLNVKQLAIAENVELIITGSKSENALSHLINGSNANDILDAAPCPVLFIPDKFRYHQLKTIIFANDLMAEYPEANRFLTQLAKNEGAQIVITHFTDKDDLVAESYMTRIKQNINYAKLSVITFPRKNIARQLKEFAEDVNAGLIAMIHHKHYLLEELIISSKSKTVIKDNRVPVLVFPG